MKFLIAQASQEQLDFGDTEDMFESTDGDLFNYQVEFFEDEMVRITDSIGRIMPLDINEVGDLIDVLLRIKQYQETKTIISGLMYAELTNGTVFED